MGTEKDSIIVVKNLCECGKGPNAKHACPYDYEINVRDIETSREVEMCHCCEECEQRCADDI